MEPHLERYFAKVRREGRNPKLVQAVDRKLKDHRPYDFIYDVGERYFVHILEDGGLFPRYMSIRPALDDPSVQERLQEHVFHAVADRSLPADDAMHHDLMEMAKGVRKLSPRDATDPVFLVHERVAKQGLLQPFMDDPWIEDIHGLGTRNIMLVHKIFGMLESNLGFADQTELDAFLVRMGERMGRAISPSRPIVDGALPDGSRINVVFGEEVSKGGSSFTIRKFSEKPLPVTQLVAWGTMDARLAAYLWLCMETGMSIFVSGETASGKTTSLNGILPFIHPGKKVLTAEDTPEVLPPQKNWQQLITRERPGKEEGNVAMQDLLKAALRSRPDCIIVGEIRGAEGAVAFQAMQTGHPTLATFHASSVAKLIQRFTSPPIQVPIEFMGNLNVVLIQMAVHVGGRMLRRVLAVEEVEGYSRRADSVITRQVFNWDPVHDEHRFGGRNNSYVLEQLVAPRLHLDDPRDIYKVLEERTAIIGGWVERGLFDYDAFADLVFRFSRDGPSALEDE